MLLRTFGLLCLLLVALGTQAQGLRPYNPTPETNIGLLTFGGAFTLGSIYLDSKVEPMSLEQIETLNFDKILAIDRYSTRHLSFKPDEFTDKLLLASFASPFFLLLDKNGRDNVDDIALIVFEGALINSALVNLSKVIAKRPRPYNYNPDAPMDLKMKKSAQYSFFSGHVATAAYFSFATAQIYSDLHPDSKAKPYVWATAALIPTAVAYGRMRAGKHFFTDVLAGFVTGTAIALTVPALHRRVVN
jgi:membrane-associated phospholipid phosphatase